MVAGTGGKVKCEESIHDLAGLSHAPKRCFQGFTTRRRNIQSHDGIHLILEGIHTLQFQPSQKFAAKLK